MKYYYFVSYNLAKNGNHGSGCCEIFLNNKIKEFGSIRAIMDHLKEKENFDEVVILNYQLMKVENE